MIFILIIFGSVILSDQHNILEVYYKKTVSNRRVFRIQYGSRSFSRCASFCTELNSQCVGFYFNKTNKICELLEGSQDSGGPRHMWLAGKLKLGF